ncbi:MAG: hypothetical protein P5683_00590 [Limnospira sp. PMC 1279.21]|uniref:hypothetical protein n=1 Tax=Limnospira TaxID=2596745 RepID=UPI00054E6673|nr:MULTISPECIES: hypothetical protein [unclassified Limnospira]MDT9186767.1 hypothetical protein [Limnospira sp. PMC 894.15]MDY7055451.1 hypothetical protein [Limnospira fusiformis LS22]MDT9191460.1 hypothetical protein [Limnospira sp. PMC 1245.20]MDT9212022.1 hypothetical protein [Limnospira sp. PMC 1256.20]MDT9222118.1 hypothetical protein [Limnospira sp. PMC 1279.21]
MDTITHYRQIVKDPLFQQPINRVSLRNGVSLSLHQPPRKPPFLLQQPINRVSLRNGVSLSLHQPPRKPPFLLQQPINRVSLRNRVSFSSLEKRGFLSPQEPINPVSSPQLLIIGY